MASHFQSSKYSEILRKILVKAYELNKGGHIIDQHFTYQFWVSYYYKRRDRAKGALEKAVAACRKQIEIAPQVAEAWLSEYNDLPCHVGFKQLSIINVQPREL